MITDLPKTASGDSTKDFKSLPTKELLIKLASSEKGLSAAEAQNRIATYGYNEIAREKRQTGLSRLIDNVKNPLIILLSCLGLLSYLTGDLRATVVILVMVLLGVKRFLSGLSELIVGN